MQQFLEKRLVESFSVRIHHQDHPISVHGIRRLCTKLLRLVNKS
jgi:hypothetical protein